MRRFIAIAYITALSSPVNAALDKVEMTGLDIDITQSTIEDLINIKITTASKKPKTLSHSPAAVFVLTSDDIRRSGVTSIPEALRLVPGVQVARVDANKWAVSIRGFNTRAANKLLVLIDGRSIYDPLFTGTLWETKDVMLEDVARIEVVRGPGGALWGANAVNGVINIITKSASDTRGGLVAAGAGTEESGFASLRYGLELKEGHDLRVYGKWLERDAGFLEGDNDPDDESRFAQAGFRYDGRVGDHDTVTLQGDVFDGEQGSPNELLTPQSNTSGINVLGRWIHELAGGSQTSLQFYYDHTDYEFSVLGEERDTFDIEFQHTLARSGSHQLVWGVNYRTTHDNIQNSGILALQPDNRSDTLTGVFVQDEIELLTEKLFLTVGSKFESNDYTGSNIQPNIRLAWQINDSNIFWTSVSSAVRTPSRLEHDAVITLPGGLNFAGAQQMKDEELTAYETGLRFKPMEDLYLDIAAFINQYDHLLTTEGLTIGNKSSGDTRGVEIAATYIPTDSWKLLVGYSYLQMDLALDADSLDDPVTRTISIEGSNPEQQAFICLDFSPTTRYQFDIALRYVDELPAQNVDNYLVADLHLAFNINDNLQLSLVGQHLLETHHAEQAGVSTSEVEDGWYAKLLYAF
jgi:iron complex outermembrane receptor protein